MAETKTARKRCGSLGEGLRGDLIAPHALTAVLTTVLCMYHCYSRNTHWRLALSIKLCTRKNLQATTDLLGWRGREPFKEEKHCFFVSRTT